MDGVIVADTTEVNTGERRAGLGRSYAVTLAGSGGVLVLTLFTGVVSARLLGPDGRGAVGAIAAWAMLASFIGGVGFRDGMNWLEARDGRLTPKVLTSTVMSTAALAIVTIVVTQLFVPLGFRAQADTVVRTAQVAMVWVLPYMMYNALGSLFGARQQFGAITWMRVGQPFLYAVGLGVVWWIDRVGIGEVVALQALSFVIPALLAFVVLARQSGMGRFDGDLTRQGASYGFRAFGSTLGQLANSRLDLLVLPAILLAADIGLYVVAVSAASMIVGLFGSLSLVVFPAAARAGGAHAVALTRRAIRLVLLASALVAITIGVVAPWLVELLYGSEFSGAVTPLRLLLPGTCCWAAAAIVSSGLKAIGRPGSASAAQFVGVGVTVVGLAVLLGPFGIAGAAIASSLSYFTVLVVGLVLFARASNTTIGGTFAPHELVADVNSISSRLRGRITRRS
jgi:enterobacterial common antigen flippase